MPVQPHITRLPNDVVVASVAMPDRASVSLGLWVAAGSRHETPALNGACHFIEHMLFKGTRRRSAAAISQAVEGVGGYLNAFTAEENTCFYARARHDRLRDLVDVLADMFLHSRFDEAEVAKERRVIKEEVAMYLDQPQQHVQELLNATLWPNQPLGRPITGTNTSLDGLTRNHLLRFKTEHYVAAATIIAAAGHVDHQQLLRAVTPFARHLPRRPRPTPEPASEHQTRPSVSLANRSIEQTQLALGFRTCSRHDPRRFPLRVLNTLLGENMSSRLFQALREDTGLAYSIFTSCSHFNDTGDFVVSAGLDTDKLARALRLITAELRRIVRHPPSRAECRRARDYILGQMDLSLENTESQMLWIGEQLVGHSRLTSPATIRRRIASVTPAQVSRVARDFIRSDRLSLALVSPIRSRRHLLPLLTRLP